ncbi:MAG: type II toxin-antitoxin system PemK/MazF family toxin [Bryobacter sp.]|nr:type II toxin-antitoxin system PemK/MazF family toxin [Bryobacter sp.]
MKRGDIAKAALPGDYGKPRPVLIIQSDLFLEVHPSIAVCPLTSFRHDLYLFRIDVPASAQSGLKVDSQVMIDKITAISRERVGGIIGHLSPAIMDAVDKALARWLALG